MRLQQELVDNILDDLFLAGPHNENRSDRDARHRIGLQVVLSSKPEAFILISIDRDPSRLRELCRVVQDSPHIGVYIERLCLILTSDETQATCADATKPLEALPILKHLQFGYPASRHPRIHRPPRPPPAPPPLSDPSSSPPSDSKVHRLLIALLSDAACLQDLKLCRIVFEDVSRCTSLASTPPHMVIQSLHLCAMRESDVAAMLTPESGVNIRQLRTLVAEDTLISPLLMANSETIEFVRYTSQVGSTSPHLLAPFGNLGNLKALKTLTFLHHSWTDWRELVPLLEPAQHKEEEADKEHRKSTRVAHAGELASWKQKNGHIRERNEARKVTFAMDTAAWEVERDEAKHDKRKRGWEKPKGKDYGAEIMIPVL
ncbi:hypothetical protein B0H14DRAFT_3486970 [Mycena olivaceomarginata]|nr:hypothetical protein B0H14DRAFT_3486970 [Mycena olivaceomarginata]